MSSYFNQLMAHHGIRTQAQAQAQTTNSLTPGPQEPDPAPLFEEAVQDLLLEAPEPQGPAIAAAPSDGSPMAQAPQISVNQTITAERRPSAELVNPWEQPRDPSQPRQVGLDQSPQPNLVQPVNRQSDQPTRYPSHPLEPSPFAAQPKNRAEPGPVVALPTNKVERGPVVAQPTSQAEPHSSASQPAIQPLPTQELGAAALALEQQLPTTPDQATLTRETVGESDQPAPVALDPEALQAAVLQQVLAWVSGPPQPILEPPRASQASEKAPPPVSLAARINPTQVIEAATPLPRNQKDPPAPSNRSAPQQPLRLEIGSIQVTVEAPASPKQPERTTPSRRENPFGSSHHFRRFFF